MHETIRFTLNNRPVTLDTDPARKLLWVLRTDLDLTGAKYGCGIGACAACTVIVDGEAVPSCQTEVGSLRGKDVTTVEGLARGERLHPLQEAFIEHGGFQCGYCTSGMLMHAVALLRHTPHPTREEIVQGMEGNLCRCGAHQRIVAAIEAASGQGGTHD
jgi:aerobic-type carbon monoxide dehydrogenase small subunit (CoxS/CutS family)